MNSTRNQSAKGYTLIATLLLLVLMTGLGLGMMMMTNTETTVGGNDMENTLAYHGAEAGMEKMTVDLADLYTTLQSPLATDVSGLGGTSNGPSIPGITFDQYTVSPQSVDSTGHIVNQLDTISQGQNAGLYAEVSRINLTVAAHRPSGMSVNMMRTVEVAEIPVFQFGVFSQGDLSYYPGPDFTFAGRVATNGNLFLADGGDLIFQSKLSAVGEVVRDYLANGFANLTNYPGPVYIPNAPNGCTGVTPPTANCINLSNSTSPPQGSVYGGLPGAGATTNPNWVNISTTTYKSYVINHTTGAKALSMPFVGGAAGPIEVVRQPPAGESALSTLGESRDYNRAAIRILLADSQARLHVNSAGTDLDDVQLVNNLSTVSTTSTPVSWTRGGSSSAAYGPVVNVAGTGGTTANPTYSYFAEANQDCAISDANAAAAQTNKWCEPNDQYTPAYVTGRQWNLLAADQTAANKGAWLRVEYYNKNTNAWTGVTREWLSYGFARGPVAPTAPGTNTVHPSAILILQQQADRDGNGTITGVTTALSNSYAPSTWATSAPYTYNNEHEAGTIIADTGLTGGNPNSATRYIWFPINLYDPREGEIRDVNTMTAGTCAPNGIINMVELDVGNLRAWLSGTGAYSTGNGPNVNYAKENGYVLYFSDRRGMQPDTNPASGSIYPSGVLTGEYGFEDTINASTAAGTPDGVLEPNNYEGVSPEDVDGKGTRGIDTWGAQTVMDGYVGLNYAKSVVLANTNVNIYGSTASASSVNYTRLSPRDPYTHRFNCMQVGRKNLTAGARHALRLIDGALGNVPVRIDNGLGGFTVASENPVYVLGNYNANNSGFGAGNSAAAIIADAVTLLSSSWSDLNSFQNPFTPGNRNATTTWYRMAIAAGKTINFVRPTSFTAGNDFGTDGGLHNFLRYIENWGGQTLNYQGSLVSLFWSEQGNGTFKCCTTVYSPPTRAYSFDLLFLNPQNLPPGTPMFEDVDNLSYRQDFTAR